MMQRDFTQRLDEFLTAYHQQHGITGVVRVTREDEILYRRCLGEADRERKLPFDEKSLFTLYSLSKAYCALGLLKLVERGLLDLDAHPSRYVPETAGLHPKLTLRNMLLHVSGMPDFAQSPGFLEKYDFGAPARLREHISHLAEFPQFFEPEQGMLYSKAPFVIATVVIENLTGQRYEDFMQKEVFLPLGSRTLTVHTPGTVHPHRVMGYEKAADGTVTPFLPECEQSRGSGDILGTEDDVYLLHRVVKEECFFEKKETHKLLFSRLPAGHFSFGCRRMLWHGRDRIVHNGGHRGFRTYHLHLPQDDDLDIIILSNSGWGNARVEISEAIYRFYFGEDAAAEAINLDNLKEK